MSDIDRPPKDYPDPLDEPDPFEPLRNDLKIRVYLALIVIVIIGTVVLFVTRAEAQEPVPFAEDCEGSPADECQVFNQATVWALTGKERTLSWCEWSNDVATMELFYRLEGLRFPPKDPAVPVMTFEGPEGTTSTTWTPTRAGLYYFRIRSCRTDIDQDGEPIQDDQDPTIFHEPEQRADGSWMLCSVWNRSLNDQGGEDGAEICGDPGDVRFPRGFIYNIQIAPATGGTID